MKKNFQNDETLYACKASERLHRVTTNFWSILSFKISSLSREAADWHTHQTFRTQSYNMSKKTCLLFKNGQDFLDKQYTLIIVCININFKMKKICT